MKKDTGNQETLCLAKSIPFVVVSGLPASGKSTLSRRLATALSLPMLDKDDILEGLFESLAPETRIGDSA